MKHAPKIIEFGGLAGDRSWWADRLGISRAALCGRLATMPLERALTQPNAGRGSEKRVHASKNRSGKLDHPGPNAPGERVRRICQNPACGREFWARRVDVERGWAKFGSTGCSAKAQRGKREVKCIVCGKKFMAFAHGKGTRKTCSKECLMSLSMPPIRRCPDCGKDFVEAGVKRCGPCRSNYGRPTRSGEALAGVRFVRLAEFAKIARRSYQAVNEAARSGVLSLCFDGALIDSEHPAAKKYIDIGKWGTKRRGFEIGGIEFGYEELSRATGVPVLTMRGRVCRGASTSELLQPTKESSRRTGSRAPRRGVWSLVPGGPAKSLPDWARSVGLPPNIVSTRVLQHGWPLRRALKTPCKAKGPPA